MHVHSSNRLINILRITQTHMLTCTAVDLLECCTVSISWWPLNVIKINRRSLLYKYSTTGKYLVLALRSAHRSNMLLTPKYLQKLTIKQSRAWFSIPNHTRGRVASVCATRTVIIAWQLHRPAAAGASSGTTQKFQDAYLLHANL